METTLEKDIELEETINQDVTTPKTTPMQALAIAMHDTLCHYNHTDYCGWYYEINKNVADWTRYTHKDYFAKAVNFTRLNPNVATETLTAMVKAIKEA